MLGSARAFAPSATLAAMGRRGVLRTAAQPPLRRIPQIPALRRGAAVAPLMTAAAKTITGPQWMNTDEYASLDDAALQQDLAAVDKLTDEMTLLSAKVDLGNLDAIDVDVLVQVTRKSTEASVLLMNVATFAGCESSVDGTNKAARAVSAQIRAKGSKLTQATQPIALALKLISDDKVQEFLAACPEETFNVAHQRKLKDFTLSLDEENLVTAMSVDGHGAWSQLYTSLSSTLQARPRARARCGAGAFAPAPAALVRASC
jgi:oligoendopeptidase F